MSKIISDIEYFEELLHKYQKKPVICSYCGKPLIFKDYVKQYDQERKFCDKKCYTLSKKENKPVKDSFSSITEEVIYNFLTQNYSNYEIRHNVTDIIEPYELDFVFDHFKLVIEYNGRLHYTNRYCEKRTRKTKLNDTKKKKLLVGMGYCVCRLWSELGLYTRPELFQRALCVLKENVDKCLINPHRCGLVVDMLVSINENIEIREEKLKK